LSYKVRELVTDEDFQLYSQPKVIKEIETLVKSTLTWLNDDGGFNADSSTLKSKLEVIKGLVDPIQDRKSEAQKRPELTVFLKEALSQAKSMIELVKVTIQTTDDSNREMEAKAKAEAEAASSSSSAAAEAAATATETATSATDPLADLEEEITSTSSSVEEKATILPVPAVSPYTEEDLEDLNDAYGRISEWLEEKLSTQESLKPHEPPAFKSEELQRKAKDLNDAVMQVLAKSMKNAKGKKAPPKSKKTKTKSAEPEAPSNFMAGVKKDPLDPRDHDEL
jgi:hypoxia up-regulated 1